MTLTHWPLEDVAVISKKVQFSNSFYRTVARAFSAKMLSDECHTTSLMNLTNEMSTFVQLMAWCHQAKRHYLSQSWPRFMSSNGITRAQWINTIKSILILDVPNHLLTHCGLVMPYDMASVILINTGSGNDLLSDNTKSLSDPLLTYHQWDPHEHISVNFD